MENYEEIYENHYKDLPTLAFVIALSILSGLALLDFTIGTAGFTKSYNGLVALMIRSESAVFWAFVFWVGIAFAVSFIVRFIVSVSISQKVVMTDALIEIRNKTR